MRPNTAHGPINRDQQRKIYRSYGKFSVEDLGLKENSKVHEVWAAFGAYIAKTIKQGKGVAIPKLGQFTFTSVNVDLAGSTNSCTRDTQERFPVFLIGKDFNCHLPIQQGIASGMTSEMFGPDGQHQNQTNHIRIFGNQGQSGIIPKVKINFFEISSLTDGAANKDDCKQIIE